MTVFTVITLLKTYYETKVLDDALYKLNNVFFMFASLFYHI